MQDLVHQILPICCPGCFLFLDQSFCGVDLKVIRQRLDIFVLFIRKLVYHDDLHRELLSRDIVNPFLIFYQLSGPFKFF